MRSLHLLTAPIRNQVCLRKDHFIVNWKQLVMLELLFIKWCEFLINDHTCTDDNDNNNNSSVIVFIHKMEIKSTK